MLVKMETYFDGEFWCARGIEEAIFTQGRTLDELSENIKEAVAVHYGETTEPVSIITLSEIKLLDARNAPGQKALPGDHDLEKES